VTAETAAVLPVLVLFAMALVWGLLAVGAQLRCVDAARTGARAAARQDPEDEVARVAREAAPQGARITVSRGSGLVRVVVVARPPGLGGLPFDLREEAVAADEEGPGDPAGTAGEGNGDAYGEATSAPSATSTVVTEVADGQGRSTGAVADSGRALGGGRPAVGRNSGGLGGSAGGLPGGGEEAG
jgi:hypothetical protein